jgi:hypothetical protein
VSEQSFGVSIRLDYDPTKWVLIPPADVVDYGDWAARIAHSWAVDLDRESDANWPVVLERMLLRAAQSPGAARWDARFAHIVTPRGEAPSIGLTCLLMSLPEDEPRGLANALPAPDDPELVEPPVVEVIELHPSVPATRIVRYTRGEDDDSVRVELFVTWRGHEHADLTLFSSAFDIGRILIMREDVVDLARSISLVPLDRSEAQN